MTDLSPAAQAVMDHFLADVEISLEHGIAASLRALAEAVAPMPLRPYDSCCDHQRAFINTRIHDIASELENTDA